VAELEDIWLSLADEPIGSIVANVRATEPAIDRLIDMPERLLAFQTFSHIRVGILLGQLLVEHDVPPYDGSQTWVEALLKDPGYREQVAREVRAVAEEIAADPAQHEEEAVGPDEGARERFRAFAKNRLG
jgi:hypothetical protein